MGRKMKLDFTGVESFLRASEGEHVAKVAAADVQQSQGGNDMIVCQFEVVKGNDKGAKVYENFPLTEKALWKLKSLLVALGIPADGKVQLDLDRLIGKTCIINVFHEEYDGKVRAKIDAFKKATAVATDDEAEDDDEVEEDLPFAEEAEKANKKAKKPAKEEAMNPPTSEDDDDWEEDEEEEEKPKKKEKAAPKKEEKKSKSDDDDDWDDDDWDE